MPRRALHRGTIIIALLGLLALGAALPAPGAPTPWTDKDLPSWQGPTRRVLLEYIYAVSTPGHRDFIPVPERIAAFDLDGTLISERPRLWVMEVALARLARICGRPSARSQDLAGLCAAAARRDYGYLRRHIGQSLSLPLLGMTRAGYRALARQVFETAVNPVKKLPLRRMVYRPQVELIDLLHRRGFRVYIVSGSDQFAMMAISRKYLHVAPERCIGTTFQVRLELAGGRLRFYRTGLRKGDVNLRRVKAKKLMARTGLPPVLAFGNSPGDTWMLRFAASAPRRSLCLVLDHDDPREFVYRRRRFLTLARRQGWQVVSIKRDFKVVF